MRARPAPRFSRYLVVLALLGTVLPLVALVALNLAILRGRLEASLLSQGRRLAASVADSAAAFLGPAQASVRVAAAFAARGDAAALESLLELQGAYSPYFGAFSVVDGSDRIVSSVPPSPSTAKLPVGDLAWVRLPREEGRPYVSDSFISLNSGRPTAIISAAAEGSPLVVGMELNLASLGSFVANAGGEGAEVLIADGRGVVLAAGDQRLVEEQANFLPQVRGPDPAGGRAWLDAEGRARVGFTARVPGLDWRVLVSFRRSELFRPVASFERAALGAGLLAVLAFGLLAFLAARRVLASFSSLRALVSAIGAGRYGEPPLGRAHFREFAELAEAVAAIGQEISRREASLKEAIAQRDLLLKEVHHRVKNNMQIVSSLISLQQGALPDGPGSAALAESAARVQALSLVHERIYRSGDFSRLDLGEYVRELCEGLVRGAGDERIRLELEAERVEVPPDLAIPLGLCVNEIVSNSIKYAFPRGAYGTVRAEVRREGGRILLALSDDGIGFDPGRAAGKSIGRSLVAALVEQIHAELGFHSGPGTRYELRLPAP